MKEMNFNEQVVETLKNEEKMLRDKMHNELHNGNYSMYKQLINAYSEIIKLIKRYDWEFRYSEYLTQVDSEHYQKQVAIWEQNDDGQIRNHKVWNVEENASTNSNEKEILYLDVDYKKEQSRYDLTILHKNEKYGIIGENLSKALNNLLEELHINKNIKIMIDSNGFGRIFYDELKENGYNVERLNNVNSIIKRTI